MLFGSASRRYQESEMSFWLHRNSFFYPRMISEDFELISRIITDFYHLNNGIAIHGILNLLPSCSGWLGINGYAPQKVLSE
jgi:hypothetical protein